MKEVATVRYPKNHEQKAAEAFGRQSAVFDEIYGANPIIAYKRQRVRSHVTQHLKPMSNILELNAGTGEDAIYFAQQGHHVHATDISGLMLEKLRQKKDEKGLGSHITTEECSFTALDNLQNQGPYDLIFSNFGGLNCTGDLKSVLQSFNALLTTKGIVCMVVMPPFSIWELTLALQGHFKTAFRRFNSKGGVQAHIEGVYFTCWYYRPSYLIQTLSKDFEHIETEGLCAIAPPSYFEHFADKRPKLFSSLTRWENRLKSKWPWRNIGDYYIISFRRKI